MPFAQIALANRRPGGFPDTADDGDQNSGEDANNRDDGQQFDQGKAAVRGATLPGNLRECGCLHG